MTAVAGADETCIAALTIAEHALKADVAIGF